MQPCPNEIRTERLILRRWRETDWPAFAALNANPHVMRFFHRTRSREESDQSARWLDERFALDGFGPWAVEVPGIASFIGFVGIWRVVQDLPFTPAIEIGWRLDEPYWGKGYALEAAQASLSDVFARTDLDEIVAYTAEPNAPSRRVMEKLGMTHDPAENFLHPTVPDGHPLQLSVLYRLKRAAFEARSAPASPRLRGEGLARHVRGERSGGEGRLRTRLFRTRPLTLPSPRTRGEGEPRT
jgi:RimJ/RimL family protein N-acetyltransferase